MKTKLVLLLSVVLQLAFVSCSTVSFVDLTKLKTDLNLKTLPVQKDYPEADAVVLWEEHDVHAIINDEYDIVTDETVTRVMKLFKNVDKYASVEIPIYSGDALEDIQARTIKPDGSIAQLKKSDFHVTTGVGEGYVFYSDEKKVKFTFPAVEKNCILELHYVIHETHPFVEGVWQIQGFTPVLRNTFKLTVPILLIEPTARGGAGWTWRYKWYNSPAVDPVVEKNLTPSQLATDQTVTFTWTKNDIPAFRPDPMMGPYQNHLEYVKFSPSEWKTWDNISKWYCKYYLDPQMVITQRISRKAEELTRGCTTEKQKIEKLFAFVQTLRYVAIELGQGGFMPAKPEEVLDRMYGDCKDKSVLLISLLKSVGIKANPVLVLTSDEGKVDGGFPTWTFNHMIVKAAIEEGETYWMDPTADHCSLGEIPNDDQGTTALVINDDNTSTLATIPRAAFNANIRDINMKVDLRNPGETVFNIRMTFRGQENLMMRDLFEDKTRKDIEKFCKSLLADQSLDARMVDYSFENYDNVDSDLVFVFKMKSSGAFEQQGDLAFLNVDPFGVEGNWSWLARDSRTYNIHFDYPGIYYKTIEVTLPKGRYSLRDLPPNAMLEQDGMTFNEVYGNEGDGKILMKETFLISNPDIEAKDFQDVKSFVNSMRNEESQKIILKAK